VSAAGFNTLAKTSSSGLMTKVFTIGKPGSLIDDATFASVANTTAQPIKITAALPAFAKLTDWAVITTAAFTGATTLGVTVGTSSGGTQLSTSNDISALNASESGAVGGSPFLTISNAATDIYVGATPTSNWNLVTAGQLKVVLTYIDNINA
jgi:hypothetical protein